MAGRNSKSIKQYLRENKISLVKFEKKLSELSNTRKQSIIRMKLEGKTFDEIGEHFGFSKQRARDIVIYFINSL